MGWSSGSSIAYVVIKQVSKHVHTRPARRAFFRAFIREMYSHDWDGESEVEGMDPDFDAVLRQLNPGLFDDE